PASWRDLSLRRRSPEGVAVRRYLPAFAASFVVALLFVAPSCRDHTVTVPDQPGWIGSAFGGLGTRVDVVSVEPSPDGEAHVTTLAEDVPVVSVVNQPAREGGQSSADVRVRVSKRQRDRIAAAGRDQLPLLVRSIGRSWDPDVSPLPEGAVGLVLNEPVRQTKSRFHCIRLLGKRRGPGSRTDVIVFPHRLGELGWHPRLVADNLLVVAHDITPERE